MLAVGSLVLMRYAPVTVVVLIFPATFVHVPLTFFWSWMVAFAIPTPDVVLSVPLIVKGTLTTTVVRLVAAVSCVGISTCAHGHGHDGTCRSADERVARVGRAVVIGAPSRLTVTERVIAVRICHVRRDVRPRAADVLLELDGGACDPGAAGEA